MALSEPKILSIKIDYELGKLSKGSICKKHRISRPTLRKHAKDGKWLYQKTFKEVSKEVEKRVIEKLLSDNTDIAVSVTDNFLKDSANIRAVTMAIMDAMATDLLDKNGKITTQEANRLIALQKVSEIANKTISNLYNTTRKALGMDQDENHNDKEVDVVESRINALMGNYGIK